MKDFILFENPKYNFGFSKFEKVNLISVKNVKDLRKAISKCQGLVVVKVNDSKILRSALEDKRVDVIIGQEELEVKDSVHQRRSGLNQVLCKLAKDNNIAIGFSFNSILNAYDRPRMIGRIMQNIKLCRKYKVRMVFATFAEGNFGLRSAKDLLRFGDVLGMSTSESKKALNFERKEDKTVKIIE